MHAYVVLGLSKYTAALQDEEEGAVWKTVVVKKRG